MGGVCGHAVTSGVSNWSLSNIVETDRVFTESGSRLMSALSRSAGLRCLSRHLVLRWDDVGWPRGRMLVHSPKTDHHPGGESRLVPIFPELRSYLEQTFDKAERGTGFIITKYRSQNTNLRTQLEHFITAFRMQKSGSTADATNAGTAAEQPILPVRREIRVDGSGLRFGRQSPAAFQSWPPRSNHCAQSLQRTSACSRTRRVASSCRSGG